MLVETAARILEGVRHDGPTLDQPPPPRLLPLGSTSTVRPETMRDMPTRALHQRRQPQASRIPPHLSVDPFVPPEEAKADRLLTDMF